jgi:ADP-ribose pyrophosphatase YjhB (NUDIX family)
MRIIKIASALITDGDWMLLVRQKLPNAKRSAMQAGAYLDDYFWGFAGGKVEPHETWEQAVTREVAEETGLIIPTITPPVLTCAYGDEDKVWGCHVMGFHLMHPYTDHIQHNDPDGEVTHVEWFRYTKALSLIAKIPWRCMSEPMLHYLEHRQPKHDWDYVLQQDGSYKRV